MKLSVTESSSFTDSNLQSCLVTFVYIRIYFPRVYVTRIAVSYSESYELFTGKFIG